MEQIKDQHCLQNKMEEQWKYKEKEQNWVKCKHMDAQVPDELQSISNSEYENTSMLKEVSPGDQVLYNSETFAIVLNKVENHIVEIDVNNTQLKVSVLEL